MLNAGTQAGGKRSAFGGRRGWPLGRLFWLQLAFAVLLGIVAGVYALVALAFELKIMVLLLVAAVGICAALVAGVALRSVRLLLLAAIVVDIPLQFDVNLARDELMAHLDAISGFSVSITTLALLVLYLQWLADIVSRRTPPPRRETLFATSTPLLVYSAIVFASGLFATSRMQWLAEVYLLLQAVLLYIYIIHTVRSRRDVLFVAAFMVIALVLENLTLYLTKAIGSSVDFGVLRLIIHPNGRVGGTLGSPNVAASILSLFMTVALSLLVAPVGPWPKRLCVLLLFASGGALVLTGSRGAWLSTAIAFGIFYFLCWRRGWLSLTAPLLMALVAIPILFFLRDMILMRLMDDNGSAESRLPLIRLALAMLDDHWLFGVGANNFAIELRWYLTAAYGGLWIRVVHNKFLLVWVETGIAGLAAYVWFLLASLRRGWQVWLAGDRLLSPLGLGLTGAMFGWILHMFVAIYNWRANTFGLLLIAGLIVAYERILVRETAPSTAPQARPVYALSGAGRRWSTR